MRCDIARSPIYCFLRAESGAVTVDWTVLAAAVVGLGVATVGAVRTGVVDLGDDINGSLSGASVAALNGLGVGTPFEYALLAATQQQYDSMLAHFAAFNDEAFLQSEYTRLSERFMQELSTSSDPSSIAYFLDRIASVDETLVSKGINRPAGSSSVEDILNAYNQRLVEISG